MEGVSRYNIFLIHGTGGHPQENWFSWLKKKLEQKGCKVIVPQFPTPENQNPAAWFEVLRKYENDFNENTILIGHSLGGTFLLHVLEHSRVKIKAAFLVAAPIGIMPIKNYKTDKPFLDHLGGPNGCLLRAVSEPRLRGKLRERTPSFNFEKIRKNCGRFFVLHSDNDPLVSLENGKELSKKLKTSLTLVPGAGHFNSAAGYKTFNLLLDIIRDTYL